MKKVILSLLLFFTLLLAAGIFLPYLFKAQIIEAAKREANKTMNATLDFDNSIKINIFKSFPNLHITMKDLVLIPTDSAFNTDTLFYSHEFQIAIDIMEFYRNRDFIIRSFELNKADLNLIVNNNNKANWDIFKTDSSEESNLALQFDQIKLSNCNLLYSDTSLDVHFFSRGINLKSKGEFVSDSLFLDNTTSIDQLSLSYAGIPYLSNHQVKHNGLSIIDLSNYHFVFPKNEIELNGLSINSDIDIRINEEDIDFDILANSTESDLNSYLSLIPAVYRSDYNSMISEGKGALSFSFKGKYGETSFPAYRLKLTLDKGKMKYPGLKHSLSNIFVDLELVNNDGILEHSVLNIPKFHFRLDNDPFDGNLYLKNIFSKPVVKAQAVGHIDLEKFANLLPKEEGSILNGKLYTKLAIDGTVGNSVSSFESLNASGEIEAFQLRYKTKSMQELLYIADAKFILDNNRIVIPILSAQWGKDDVNFKGELNNYLGYLLRDEEVQGEISWYSKNLNLNNYIIEGESVDTASKLAIEIPNKLNIGFNAVVDQLEFGKYKFNNIQTDLLLNKGELDLYKLAGSMLGGNIEMSGKYRNVLNKPFAAIDLSFADLTSSEILSNWPWVKSFAPVIQQIEANTLAKLSFKSTLKENMAPILNELNLGGTLSVENLMLDQLDILQKLDKKLGFQQFAVKELRDLMLNFSIKDGNLRMEPFSFVMDSSKLELQGISKLDGSLDYKGKLSIPSSYFKNQQNGLNSLLKKSSFTTYQYSASDFYEIAVSITGTFYKPEISLNLKEIKKNVAASLKQGLQSEKEKAVKKINEQAKSEFNELRDTVKQSAELAKQKMIAELERQKKEAEEKLRQEAEEKKKKLKEEAEKKLKGLLK